MKFLITSVGLLLALSTQYVGDFHCDRDSNRPNLAEYGHIQFGWADEC